MKRLSGLCVLMVLFWGVVVSSRAQVWTELASFQSSTNYFTKIVADSSGTFFIGGHAYDSLLLDTTSIAANTVLTANGGTDCFILRSGADCRPAILHQFGGSGTDQINDMVLTAEQHFVVTGRFSDLMTIGDSTLTAPVREAFYIAELSHDSTPIWCRAANAFSGASLALFSNGDVLVGGVFTTETEIVPGEVLEGYGEHDLFYARFDATGTPRWAVAAGSAVHDHTPLVACAPDGGLYCTGVFFDTLFFNGFTDTIVAESNLEQSYVYKLDNSGNVLWKKSLASDGYAICYSVVTDSLGYLYAAGRYSGTFHIGSMEVTSEDEHSMFVVRISPDGTPLWIQSVDLAIGYCIALGDKGTVMVTGNYQREATFGAWHFSAKDIENIFVAGYTFDGDYVWALDGGCCRTAMSTMVATNSREFLAAGAVDGVLVGRFCNINFSGISEDFDNESLGRTFLAAFDPYGDAVKQPNRLRRVSRRSDDAGAGIRYYDLSGRAVSPKLVRKASVQGSSGVFRIVIRVENGLQSNVISAW